MVERTRGLDIACHLLLVLGGLLVCVPIWFAFVVGSHTTADVLTVPPPWLPGDRFLENAATAWVKGNLGRLFVNSFVVAVGIAVGKIAVSLLSAFAIAYFRFRWRMVAFWLIFVSLMLPVEVRILPTYEAVANVALPLQWMIDVLDVGRWISALTGRRVEIALEWNMMNSYGGLILPLIASATATFLFLYGWNQYLWPLLFTTDKDMTTAVIGLKHLIPQSDSEPAWNVAMNAALLVMLPPALVVVALQRWLVKGLVDSGK